MNIPHLTKDSEELFKAFLSDAGNWDGHPMLNIDKGQTGNLTDLKKKHLVTTRQDEENPQVIWVSFTGKGLSLAKTYGYDNKTLGLFFD